MKLLKKLLIPVVLFFLSTQAGVGQSSTDSTITYKPTDKSTMKITGTSTVHDWEADVKKFDVTLDLSAGVDNMQAPKADDYKSVRVEVTVKKIKSGKGGMDSRIYDALKKDKHPTITFEMSQVTEVSTSTTDTTFTLDMKGDLTIAGVTRTVTIENIEGQSISQDSYHFKGSKSMKMTDFKVEPPSAMFGAIKAGDKITVSFDLTMAPMNQKTASK